MFVEHLSIRVIDWDHTLPETNSEFAPENGWLEDDPFLLGWGLIAGLIKGNEWLISPDHKALSLGGYVRLVDQP